MSEGMADAGRSLEAPPLIEVANVSKWFGAHQVLSAVSFVVHRSEVVCIIGPWGPARARFYAA